MAETITKDIVCEAILAYYEKGSSGIQNLENKKEAEIVINRIWSYLRYDQMIKVMSLDLDRLKKLLNELLQALTDPSFDGLPIKRLTPEIEDAQLKKVFMRSRQEDTIRPWVIGREFDSPHTAAHLVWNGPEGLVTLFHRESLDSLREDLISSFSLCEDRHPSGSQRLIQEHLARSRRDFSFTKGGKKDTYYSLHFILLYLLMSSQIKGTERWRILSKYVLRFLKRAARAVGLESFHNGTVSVFLTSFEEVGADGVRFIDPEKVINEVGDLSFFRGEKLSAPEDQIEYQAIDDYLEDEIQTSTKKVVSTTITVKPNQNAGKSLFVTFSTKVYMSKNENNEKLCIGFSQLSEKDKCEYIEFADVVFKNCENEDEAKRVLLHGLKNNYGVEI